MTLSLPAVCPFKTCPCVRSKRLRLCQHQFVLFCLFVLLVLVCHADPSSPPSTHAPTTLTVCTFKTPPRVHIQNVSVCTSTTSASVTTCGRGARTYGDVLNVHTEVLSVPHHTARTHRDRNDTHNTTHGERRQRKKTEKGRQRKGDRERDKTRERETRQDKTREEKIKRREERRDKRQEKRKDEREK